MLKNNLSILPGCEEWRASDLFKVDPSHRVELTPPTAYVSSLANQNAPVANDPSVSKDAPVILLFYLFFLFFLHLVIKVVFRSILLTILSCIFK